MKRKQADALDAYWKSQNQKIKQLENFVEQGGSISPELNQMTKEFEQSGIGVFEQLMQGQKMLLSQMEELLVKTKTDKENRQIEEKEKTIEKTLQAEQISSVPATKKNTNPWANEIIDALDLNDKRTMKRLEVQMVECEDTPRGNKVLPKSGIMLMLGEKDAYGTALENYFVKHGLKTKWVDCFIAEDETASKQIKEIAKDGELVGMAVLGNRYYSEEENEHYYDYIMTIAYLLKHITTYMNAQKSSAQKLFLFHTFLDGKLGTTGKSEYCQYGAFNGIAKTLWIELQGKAFVKEIDFEPTIDAETMVTYMEDELCCHDIFPEIGRTKDGLRYRPTTVLTKSIVTENKCPLKEDDVILVSGGARGVTSSCIIELAKKVKCKFVILGRAEITEENADDEETEKITELKDMKALIAKRFKAQGYKGSFVAMEAKAKAILAQRDMLHTFKSIRETKNPVYYYSCDVNNYEQMKKVMEQIQKEVGKVTAVVHGAGVLADAKIWNKDMKGFKLVFDTKYRGLNNIMDFVDKNSLKALVMFSSIAGYFGNDGQMDYAAGNEYFDKYAYYIRERYPNCHALAINWGAWDGGMMDYIYRKAMTEKGYVLIPLEVGANYFANEFLMGLPSAQILINNSGVPIFN